MGLRAALHQVGSVALEQLLQFDEPTLEHRARPCSCGHPASYVELRSKTVLTVVGKVELSRPYYLCPQCGNGQFPVDIELDVSQTMKSPGVRRMLAMVGQESAFARGQQQMRLLAGLEITAKAVERTAEAIGADLGQREQQEIQRGFQLELPAVLGKPIPVLYIEMDGTGLPHYDQELLRAVIPHVSPPPPPGLHAEYVLAAVIAERRRRDADRLAREDARRSALLPIDPLGT